MDKASDFESEDCEFESRRGQNYISLTENDSDSLRLYWKSSECNKSRQPFIDIS